MKGHPAAMNAPSKPGAGSAIVWDRGVVAVLACSGSGELTEEKFRLARIFEAAALRAARLRGAGCGCVGSPPPRLLHTTPVPPLRDLVWNCAELRTRKTLQSWLETLHQEKSGTAQAMSDSEEEEGGAAFLDLGGEEHSVGAVLEEDAGIVFDIDDPAADRSAIVAAALTPTAVAPVLHSKTSPPSAPVQ